MRITKQQEIANLRESLNAIQKAACNRQQQLEVMRTSYCELYDHWLSRVGRWLRLMEY